MKICRAAAGMGRLPCKIPENCALAECEVSPEEEAELRRPDGVILTKDAVQDTLAIRANKYGDFADVARISQSFQEIARQSPGWARMNTTQREGATLILHKLARALSGDPEYADNWHDIAGYAKLVEDRLDPNFKMEYAR